MDTSLLVRCTSCEEEFRVDPAELRGMGDHRGVQRLESAQHPRGQVLGRGRPGLDLGGPELAAEREPLVRHPEPVRDRDPSPLEGLGRWGVPPVDPARDAPLAVGPPELDRFRVEVVEGRSIAERDDEVGRGRERVRLRRPPVPREGAGGGPVQDRSVA